MAVVICTYAYVYKHMPMGRAREHAGRWVGMCAGTPTGYVGDAAGTQVAPVLGVDGLDCRVVLNTAPGDAEAGAEGVGVGLITYLIVSHADKHMHPNDNTHLLQALGTGGG